jgi:alpha-L-fucosidase
MSQVFKSLPIKRIISFSIFLISSFFSAAQPNVHPQSVVYEKPRDSAVLARLDHWQDQKFGMLIHWGLYSEAGILESWNLCSEDWINRDSNISYDDYKKWYWGLKAKFNPVNFDPDSWAAAARDAGMRYVVFTTKHHDGFNMFDTHQTDFKISDGPFKSNPKSDVAKYVFDAFRRQGFMIGAYFSKPDWHSENYWWPRYATPDRYNNYDIRKFPWRWENFKSFTYNQISELMHNYGAIDILWLDGGWVRPLASVDEEVRAWGARIPEWDQDIDIPHIAKMAREAQPGILIVDRTVHGPFENYQTPEQKIPEKQLDVPWESCITLAGNWGYVPGDHYKAAGTIIQYLIEVVAKGGSLLLGVGPKPDGTLSQEAVVHLEEIGRWMNKNGESIYNTRITKDYHQDNIWFTVNPGLKRKYALVCLKEGGTLPSVLVWKNNIPAKGSIVTLLQTGTRLKWKTSGNEVRIFLPESVYRDPKPSPALAISFTPES